MRIQSMVAVYFVVWWMSLFLVLPFGVRNAAEEGEAIEEGHEPGAPLRAMLWRKAAINTVLSAAITAGVILAFNSGVLGG